MNEIEIIVNKLLDFRRQRNWKKYHKPKDLAISLVLEVGELLEHFQWKSNKEVSQHVIEKKEEVAEELADVFNWVLLLSHDLKIDIIQASLKKIEENNQKYPISKTKGTYTKYNKL